MRLGDALGALRLGGATAALPVETGQRYVPTGMTDLDGLTGGLRAGDLWVVTGRSGAGKSVLGLGLARVAAVRHGARTGHVRGRDRLEDLVLQVVSAEGRVPLHGLRTILDGTDRDRAARTVPKLVDAPLWFASTEPHGGSVLAEPETQIATAKALLGERGLELLVVDDLLPVVTAHLQELKATAVRGRTCVVAVLCAAGDREREAVERDAATIADIVVRVDRDHEMTPGGGTPRAGEADLLVLRHRRGPIAAVTVAFQGQYAMFVDMPSV